MILTCPQCATKFELDAALLAPDGKRVRCSNCGHDWFQLPEPEEGADEAAADIPEDEATVEEEAQEEETIPEPDIPDAVKPQHEDAQDDEKIKENVSGIKDSLIAHLKNKHNQIGYGIATAVFVLALILLIVFSQSLSKGWMPMTGFYNVIGVEVTGPGQGLSFERLAARYEPETGIILSGDILNLASDARSVPMIKASLIIEGQAVPLQWLITPPEAMIDAESAQSFNSEFAYDGEAMPKNITLSFDLKANPE